MIIGRQCTFGAFLALVSAASAVAEEQTFGRLFFTPEQRQQLDAGRLDAIANRNRPPPVKAIPVVPKAAPPQVVTLHGVVRRSDGETTVWVNGRAVSSRFADADIHAGTIASDSVGFDIPGAKRRVRLKVGQSVEAISGTVEEGYRRRRTRPSAVVPVEPAAVGDTGEARVEKPPAVRRRERNETPDSEGLGDS